MPSNSSFGPMPTNAATVALYCLSRVAGSECFSQSAWTAWLARVLFQWSEREPLADLRRQVTVIVAGGNVAALAVKKTTATIPIVFTSGADPVKSSLVASLSRPEGNLTGVSLLAVEMATKRLELIRDLLPHACAVAMSSIRITRGPRPKWRMWKRRDAPSGSKLVN